MKKPCLVKIKHMAPARPKFGSTELHRWTPNLMGLLSSLHSPPLLPSSLSTNLLQLSEQNPDQDGALSWISLYLLMQRPSPHAWTRDKVMAEWMGGA